MCGILGYVGEHEAAPILLKGLKRLEYRGYDSAGLAVLSPEGEINIMKAKGRLSVIEERSEGGKLLPGRCGIGHTRWATHGEPSDLNAHPQYSDDLCVVAVHNGIIENYQELKNKLLKKGYTFNSATDTEVAVKLVDYYYKKYYGTPIDAINKAMVRIRGSYSLVLLFKDFPGEIYAARKDSPLICGKSEDGLFLASDATAILEYTRDVYYIGDLQAVRLKGTELTFYDLNGDEIEIEPMHIDWDVNAAEKGGYEHFMMKEIHEQPKAVMDTLNSVIKEGRADISVSGITDEELKTASEICIVACGSAYHVGITMSYVIEELCHVPVRVELASEFRYRRPVLLKDTLCLFISQSGETADTLAALRLAKESGYKTFSIVNVLGSSIARESEHVLYTLAGPEIAVATTKAYSAQLAAAYAFAVRLAKVRGTIDDKREEELCAELLSLPDKIEKLLEDQKRIQWFASKYAAAKDIFLIGRNVDYAIALEGSLKIKEISYIHSEAYAAGELKHGTISLIEEGTLVIGILTDKEIFEKTLSNMVECKSRGAYLMGLTMKDNVHIEDTADFTVYIPETENFF
ncbi:MAG TPA: glutamine--fructose-6-phosphate transaminase (isomerizing), partial [Candidatus Avilachnospira avistercoris]|nr:glutamine--fructose-6-phosphate transaminase (isomerizing) [Candidatus Avilachnospira avistercoris]